MATRRKKAPKSTRRGESGGANPRNDGRITEEQHDEAMRVLRAEYYQAVRGIVEDARQAIKDGEITDRDSLEQWMHQTIDGSYWVIYTHANMQVLFVSDNHDAHSDTYGEVPVDGGNVNWAALAFAALEQDVQEQMQAEGVHVGDDDVVYPYAVEEASRGRMMAPRGRQARETRGPRGLRARGGR